MFNEKILLPVTRCIVAVSMMCLSAWAFEERPEEVPKGPQVASRQPQLNTVFPMGIQPGQMLRLEVQGEFLDGATQLLFENNDISGAMVSSTFTKALVDVSVSPDAALAPGDFAWPQNVVFRTRCSFESAGGQHRWKRNPRRSGFTDACHIAGFDQRRLADGPGCRPLSFPRERWREPAI
jgi:hypothetical protein